MQQVDHEDSIRHAKQVLVQIEEAMELIANAKMLGHRHLNTQSWHTLQFLDKECRALIAQVERDISKWQNSQTP